MDFKQFLKGLQAIVGKQNVVYHSDDLLVFEYDGSVDRGMPDAVVFPSSAQEVSQIIKLSRRAGVPVVGRGTGTGLSGGAITAPGGIQVAFPRMNHILEVDTENRLALVEPGL
ncbi:MAG: FAD-binding oxidoreductase, partial [SAR202 cluster bacterium]|nr:FAD-binding oxidoreductase [SAR202 cluster bacterium]